MPTSDSLGSWGFLRFDLRLYRPMHISLLFDPSAAFRNQVARAPLCQNCCRMVVQNLPLRTQLIQLLRKGALKPQGIHEATDAKLDTIKRTLRRRYPKDFVKLADGRYGLLE
jgi:hypothetical protein